MCEPPTEKSVGAVLNPVLASGVTVWKVEAVPSFGLQRVYGVALSDGKAPLMLWLPPPSMLRLLRSEQMMVASAAAAVRWIRKTQTVVLAASTTTTTTTTTPSSSSSSATPADLLPFLPTLIHFSPDRINALGSAFYFFAPTCGNPLAVTPSVLTPPERRKIDLQIGWLLRRLAQLTSPSGRFGPVVAVMAPASPLHYHRQLPGVGSSSGGLMGTSGTGTWTMAFHSMLEGILRDGEDMAVTIAYSAIRRHFHRLSYFLDAITVPRLVVVDGAEEANTLVTDRSEENSESGVGEDQAPSYEVSGIRDWSSCIFGDPLFATVFSSQPSEGFLEGFNGSKIEEGASRPGISLSRDLIQDVESAEVRLLLYQAYHATVSIVKEFYRPRVDSSKRELEARRRLNEVLARLADVQDDPKKRHQRPSGEMSPAKRIKQDEEMKDGVL
ncbi:hypothetical protein B0H63DRAFT_394338 [Podospora didyma]|uniref:Uncharacterized protein n=1 Tax=Podospora didyma TaxID=330526 RepID=A0AAE0NNV0_9PEZI|nr:hypothetical protein B0H63DRAFT_394338 [Podospora didyma]